MYPKSSPNTNLASLEEDILAYWNKNDIFKKSLTGTSLFTLYDGPPFANGLPHYGHLLTGYIKDTFSRYNTQLGKHVEREFGWDCHGLPTEMLAEKELDISGKKSIEEFGIDKFNSYCEKSVLKYTKEWEKYVTRQGRWANFEEDYKTMDLSFMESVLWIFKSLYDKNLIYESTKVMPFSWACESAVSDFETKMDNCYREKKSKSVVVSFTLKDIKGLPVNFDTYKILVWTTTPWTLPSNLALAVGEDINYSCIKKASVCYIIASELKDKYTKEIGKEVIAEFKGSELVGRRYIPIFSYFQNHKNAFSILNGEFVTTTDGTGIVHVAPGFGEDDEQLCKKHNISTVCPVNDDGTFTSEIKDFEGVNIFEANTGIIEKLKKSENWLATSEYLHNYPHCWRTDEPLIYKAVPSWYLKTTAIKNKMINTNKQINWIPSHIKDGLFGKWLENVRDWAISRNRFFGCPIPVWKSTNPKYPCIKVFGSIKELEDFFEEKVTSLHRPFIDTLTKINPNDPTKKSKLVRVPEVLDCWFESGSMPYGKAHYPFENKEEFEKTFPADFIVEYVAQTRGWFYTLLVISTALFNKPPFLNVICHGVILGDGGEKMSKRLRNYPDPNKLFKETGSDAMRWFLLSSPVMKGQAISIEKKGKGIHEVYRKIIKTFWQAKHFFTLYANADNITASFDINSDNTMDKYIIAKCKSVILNIKKQLDSYDTIYATKSVEDFLQSLTNWYIRRSRERFWSNKKSKDKSFAYNTLYSVLLLISKATASLLPFITEAIYLGLTDGEEKESVHLTSFPKVTLTGEEVKLIRNMELIRDACNTGLYLRNLSSISIKQPLGSITLIGLDKELPKQMVQYLLDEINVKRLKYLKKEDIQSYATFNLKPKFEVLGRRIPGKIKEIIQAIKEGKWNLEKDKILIAEETLSSEEFEIKLIVHEKLKGQIAPLSNNSMLLMLDKTITEELKSEGITRNIIRTVQMLRKELELEITEHIDIALIIESEKLNTAIKKMKHIIMEQTLSKNVYNTAITSPILEKTIIVDDDNIIIQIIKKNHS